MAAITQSGRGQTSSRKALGVRAARLDQGGEPKNFEDRKKTRAFPLSRLSPGKGRSKKKSRTALGNREKPFKKKLVGKNG